MISSEVKLLEVINYFTVLVSIPLLLGYLAIWLIHIFGFIAVIKQIINQQKYKSIQNKQLLPEDQDKFSHKSDDTVLSFDESIHVDVIKPIKDLDKNLRKNLKSFIKQNYTNFTVHLCLNSYKDSAYKVCKSLQKEYPDKVNLHVRHDKNVVDNLVDIGQKIEYSEFKNPKIQNIKLAWHKCKASLLWISDAKMYAEPHTLDVLVDEISNPSIGLVHMNPIHKNMTDLTPEKIYFLTSHSMGYMGLNLIGLPGLLTGMSFIVKRSVIDHVGGIDQFDKYLAEDHYIGKMIYNNGMTMKLSCLNCYQDPGVSSVKLFYKRMKRWFKLRISISKLSILEIFYEFLPTLIYGPISISILSDYFLNININISTIFYVHFISWLIYDIIFSILVSRSFKILKMSFLWHWLVRSFIGVYLFKIWFERDRNIIEWGRVKYKIVDGQLSEFEYKKGDSWFYHLKSILNLKSKYKKFSTNDV